MGMMNTSTKFEYRGTRKMLTLYSCRQCPYYFYHKNKDNELDRNWCHYGRSNKIDVTYENLKELPIPQWCKLKNFVDRGSIT